ncbi:MAG: DUF4065 domain-containing protein [Burkholderiaceae bacterium]
MDTNKSRAVARRILEACAEHGDSSVTPMQLIKLTYIAHGYMLGVFGEPLLDEPVEAWQYGPVVRSVYDAVKKYQSSPVKEVQVDHEVEFSEREQKVIGVVAKKYCGFSGVVLSAATHQPGSPWRITWDEYGRNATISNDIIEQFYAKLVRQSKHSAL